MTPMNHSRPDAASVTSGVRSSTQPVAVSPHHLSSAAALQVMRTGGNAVDGAIAANAVQGVVAPETCGIGGDLFALVLEPGTTEPLGLNASGRAGSGTTAEELRRAGLTELPARHRATITTPGCVDGWVALSERLGRLPLAEVIAPAIALAEEGFEVSSELGSALAQLQDLIGEEASAVALYPGERPAQPGSVIGRPMLAATLRGVAADGRDSFYLGAPGRGITEASGGIVSHADLSANNAQWIHPISVDVFGHRAWTIPPNAQGYIALAAAWIFEQLDVPADPTNPVFVHAAMEAYRAVAWERDDLVSDPETAPMPAERLLDPARLGSLASSVTKERVGTFPSPSPTPGGTAYLCVRDGEGMGVSFIQSNFWGIGSGRSAGATGVFLHNRGAGFNLIEGHANEYTPGQRPLHTLAPTIWTRHDELSMILGTRGGEFQPQLLIQMIAAMLHAGAAPSEAQRLPRWQLEGWQRDRVPTVHYESRFDGAVLDGLRFRGHDIHPSAAWQPGWGPVSVITHSNGLVQGAADPRVSTSAALST